MSRTAAKTDCPRLILNITSAQRRRIKVAAAAQDYSVYAYFSRLLDRAVPVASRSDGTNTAGAVHRFAPFLAGQGAPLPEGTADLISSASWSRSRYRRRRVGRSESILVGKPLGAGTSTSFALLTELRMTPGGILRPGPR
jgi:hypothetical protein